MLVDRTLAALVAGGLALTALAALLALGGLLRLRAELARVRRASQALAGGGLYGLDQLLREQALDLRRLDERAGDLERRLGRSEAKLASALRHVGVVRFNPFRDTGGDQSFAIALLDDRAAGVVLTGLHHRAETRVFAKPVRDGVSSHPLSEEERAAMQAAREEPVSEAAR